MATFKTEIYAHQRKKDGTYSATCRGDSFIGIGKKGKFTYPFRTAKLHI